MLREAWIYVDLDGVAVLAGRLWSRVRGGRESASFQHDESWLRHPQRFALEPALALGAAAHHTPAGKALFGALGDSAPDRWGRMLMTRAERQAAHGEARTTRTLTELDYLLRVNDFARQGALRFAAAPGGEFLQSGELDSIPPLVKLPRLLSLSERAAAGEENEQLQLLLAPGSSLGGARPKASVLDRDRALAIAKFPRRDDALDAVRWEALALTLAKQGGIAVPDWRLAPVGRRAALVLRRFDRKGEKRTPFLSAMSMIGAVDGETRSYLEIADALRRHGARPQDDLRELWRRIAFNVLITNTDDHLRNHGFLYAGAGGWRLSPAYDLNPMPADLAPRFLTTAIDHADAAASLELALSVAPYFDLEEDEARQLARDVAAAIAGWREQAAALGIAPAEIKRMSSAFEHAEMRSALKL